MPSRVARPKQMRLLIESLEERCTPAGNVAAVLSGTTLVITGDAQGNEIRVAGAGDSPIRVIGLSTQVNGAAEAWFSLDSVNSIVIQMNQGNDKVHLHGSALLLSVPGSLRVDLGAGDDELEFINVTVNGSTTIRGRAGADTIAFRSGNTFNGSVLADLAQGNDLFEVNQSEAGLLPNTFNKSLRILGGAGNDTLEATDSTFKKLVVDTGVGNDLVALRSGITVQTSATVLLGVGDDILLVEGSTFGSTFFDGGPGSDPPPESASNNLGSPSSIVNFEIIS